MDIIYNCVAGLDLHKETIVAAVRRIGPAGKLEADLRTFGTMTRDLLELSDWLAAHGVTHVAMEATGVLWKPVWNILDGHFELLLVNPRELKQVPGRKSDVKDAQWIAQLLQHGLLCSSFVPGRPQRELRDLTRHRAQLEGEHTRAANRIHKLLEDANIKLGVVASDILGVSGREMLDALAAGEEDAAKLAHVRSWPHETEDPAIGTGPARQVSRASSLHAQATAQPSGPSRSANRAVQCTDRGTHGPVCGQGVAGEAGCGSGH